MITPESCHSVIIEANIADILASASLVLSIVTVILFLVFNRPQRRRLPPPPQQDDE